MRRIGGLPLAAWGAALAVGVVGFLWIKKRGTAAASSSSPATGGKPGAQSFTQAQEVQDFQIFSALTGAQQASDLNMVSELAGLFGGGTSTGVNSAGSTGGAGGGSSIPSPPSTGTTVPATVPVSSTPAAPAPAPNPSSFPGYGANVGTLLADNPALTTPGANVPGITGYTVSYNGVPI